jgi:chaperonin GroES
VLAIDGLVLCAWSFAPPADPRRAFFEGSSASQRATKESTMATIRPLQDRVLVKRVEEEKMSKGGIIIPDTAKEKPIEGEIIAVGNGKVADDGKVRPLDVKVGDRVLFGKYSGTEVKIDGQERLILREDDILGVIQN